MPKVSVVCGFYNRSEVLERTIKSILSQTYDDFEFIVFDDASTDDTAEKLKNLARQYNDNRLKIVLYRENQGFVNGLRAAIAATTGEYIAIQGSGDESLPHRLERQVAVLNSDGSIGVVGGWYSNIQEALGIERLRTPDASTLDYAGLLKTNMFSHGEVMIRRSVYEAVGGYRSEFKYAQDLDLWIRISQIATFATVPELIYRRYVQFDGVSYDPSKLILQCSYSVTARLISKMNLDEQSRVLAMLRESGPLAITPIANKIVQRKIKKGVFRLLVFGKPTSASRLAKSGVSNPLTRMALKLLIKVYNWRLTSLFVPLLNRSLGITVR